MPSQFPFVKRWVKHKYPEQVGLYWVKWTAGGAEELALVTESAPTDLLQTFANVQIYFQPGGPQEDFWFFGPMSVESAPTETS